MRYVLSDPHTLEEYMNNPLTLNARMKQEIANLQLPRKPDARTEVIKQMRKVMASLYMHNFTEFTINKGTRQFHIPVKRRDAQGDSNTVIVNLYPRTETWLELGTSNAVHGQGIQELAAQYVPSTFSAQASNVATFIKGVGYIKIRTLKGRIMAAYTILTKGILWSNSVQLRK